MQRELTISIDEQVYHDLHQAVLPGLIGPFIESLVRPRLLTAELEAGYRAIAADEEHEAEALDWSEALVTDVAGWPGLLQAGCVSTRNFELTCCEVECSNLLNVRSEVSCATHPA